MDAVFATSEAKADGVFGRCSPVAVVAAVGAGQGEDAVPTAVLLVVAGVDSKNVIVA